MAGVGTAFVASCIVGRIEAWHIGCDSSRSPEALSCLAELSQYHLRQSTNSRVYSRDRVYRPPEHLRPAMTRPRSAPGWILRAPYLPRQGFHKSFATWKQNEGTTGRTGTTQGKRDDSLSSLQCFQMHSNLLRNTGSSQRDSSKTGHCTWHFFE